ncbi:DUF4046 domain-containing protein [Halobacillus amylolyticus]|uniref:DUF4046 domain-containing protein n=1 Tax=Halobacillus amylolyticus TaxID=2932259 RepID=A0ABY4HE48_9BACI|nr:DUF4046 domain-containing protein [Halobacillus amylolyticus]UOR11675.1 DUF4046 domain-containing protein [Halobacillus amylolyticus]
MIYTNEFREMDHKNLVRDPIVKIYNEVFSGKMKALPKGTWEKERNCIIIVRFVLEVKLKLTNEQIPKITRHTIREYKLWGALNRFKSIRKLIMFVYPNQYDEFDFLRVPVDYWSNTNNIKKRLEHFISENGYDFKDIPEVVTYERLIEWGFSNPLKRWGDSPFKLINTIYPNEFTYTDFRSVPKGYGRNKELLSRHFIKMLEKEHIPFEEAPKKVTQQMLIRHRFSGALKHHNGSPSKLILSLFPDQYDITMFTKPNRYWENVDNGKQAIEELLREYNIPLQKIPQYVTKKFLKENGLSGLLDVHHGSPIEIIMKFYPNMFDVTDFQRVPNRYWYSRENRILALRNFCKKRNMFREDLPHLTHAYFRKFFPRFISLVDRHYDSKYYLWIMESFPEYKFKPEEFELMIGSDGQICDSKEELTIHNFLVDNLGSGDIIREGERFNNFLQNEVYIPDWIIKQGTRTFILEYFGLYQSNKYRGYTEKANRKIKYYKTLKDYTFIAIMPNVFRRAGFVGIKDLLQENGMSL